MGRQGQKSVALIALLAFLWAAPGFGAALSAAQFTRGGLSKAKSVKSGEPAPRVIVPRPVRLREGRGRGLLVDVWINGTGPYLFAVDTGAGTTVIRSEAFHRAGLTSTAGSRIAIGGLSNTTSVSGQQTIIDDLALGDPGNLLPSHHRVIVMATLPGGIDGVLDPSEAYAPIGYVIDMPNRQLSAFDTTTSRLQSGNEPAGGTVVRWVRENDGKRPFVRLGDNRLALIDTGSGFGLAVTYDEIVSGSQRTRANSVRDLNGGAVQSRRVAPTTVTIGSLVLRNVPTDILVGAHEDAPVILGRDALAPFKLTFDPVSRLIEIAPSTQN